MRTPEQRAKLADEIRHEGRNKGSETKLFCKAMDEKCEEYQQVAALMALDLDLLQTVSKRKDMTLDQLREHIVYTIEKRDEMINNPESRKQRYLSAAMLFSIPVATDSL